MSWGGESGRCPSKLVGHQVPGKTGLFVVFLPFSSLTMLINSPLLPCDWTS